MKIEDLINRLPAAEREKVLMMAAQYQEALTREKCQTGFLNFVREMWPGFIPGRHHAVVAKKFEDIAEGKLKRLIICMPPRHTKSQFGSYLFPAWYLGKFPNKKIIQASNTAELAVGFGRNVRNLIASDRFQNVFPNIALRQDSKAAGRWATNHNGEYFACIKRNTQISTKRGLMLAEQVVPGDFVQNAGGWVQVLEVFDSEHTTTISIAGLECSKDHPIWTINKGWVFAEHTKPSDILCVESILDRMKALIRRFHGYLEHADVSSVVQHQVSVRKLEKRKMGQLRRSWDLCLRALAGVPEFFGRHGAAALAHAHGGADRQRWAVQSGELPMGDAYRAGQQSTDKRSVTGEDRGAACPGNWGYSGSDTVSIVQGPRTFVPTQAQEEELRSYRAPEGLKWGRSIATRLFICCKPTVREQQSSAKSYLAGIGRAAQVLSGLLLGVRRVGEVKIQHHGKKPFVNFLTDGDHTFFADKILTHNCGVGGAMTGRGADFLVIDDPHSEQDALSETAMENAYDWFVAGPRQRLQPGGRILLVMTRWSKTDLTGRVLADQAKNSMADEWDVIEFPAIMPSGKPCWPEFWKLDDLLRVKAALPVSNWNAQWMQNPTAEEGAIFKREWWKVWNQPSIPKLLYVIQSYDTAYSKKETADFSAITTWGVFHPNEADEANLILLDAKKGRWDFPELKRFALEQYKYWDPDCVLIEAKASGMPLTQELRRTGIPVVNYSPGGRKTGQDKISRANSISPVFEAGFVWAPDEPWAEDLVEEMAEFPYGEYDDLTDSAVQAVIRFRQGNFLQLPSDFIEETLGPSLYDYY